MAGFREHEKRHFPLQDVRSVVNLFRDQLENNEQPNLALLSIVLGVIENALTVNRAIPQNVEVERSLQPIFPVIELSTVEALYHKFVAQIKGSVDLTQYSGKNTSRELVKKVSDVVWGSLTRTYYKDKAHLQSLYSYLTGTVARHSFVDNLHVGCWVLFLFFQTDRFDRNDRPQTRW